jgi:hypothetical protein
MADSLTTNYEFVKPEVGASSNTWGGKINADWDAIDALIKTLDFLSAAAKVTPILADRLPIIDTETDPDTTKYITFTQLKTLILAAVSLNDNIFEIIDNVDGTKKLQFQLSSVTTGNIRTLTVPDLSGTIALLTGAQEFTDKTFTQPVIILKQGAAEVPTAEGDIRWDTDDNVLVIGDGAATKIFAALPTGAAEDDLLSVGAGGKSLQRIPKGSAYLPLRMNAAGDGQEYASNILEFGPITASGVTVELSVAIPAGAKKIEIHIKGVKNTSGGGNWLVQLGAGSYETSGYASTAIELDSGNTNNLSTSDGFALFTFNMTNLINGHVILTKTPGTDEWVMSSNLSVSGNGGGWSAGNRAFGADVDRLRITHSDGSSTWNAGAFSMFVYM